MIDRDDRLAAIQARLEAATPGPWAFFGHGLYDDWDVAGPEPGRQFGRFARRADAEFIAHAPEDVAYLLNAVQTLCDEQRRALLCCGTPTEPASMTLGGKTWGGVVVAKEIRAALGCPEGLLNDAPPGESQEEAQ